MKTYLQLSWIALVGSFSIACSRDGGKPAAPVAAADAAAPAAAGAPAGSGLTPSQRDLLQLAFDAASKFPPAQHRKNRSRAQEVAVVAAFELGAPEFAVALGAKIADWRRGCAYADFAWAMARRGETARAREYVALAEGVVRDERDDPNAQEWRGDLIQLKVARALSALGDVDAAAKASGAIDQSSTHAVDAAWNATAAERVATMTAERAPAEFAALDQGFATMSLGQQAATMTLVARMHDKFFADAGLRAACEQRVAVTWDRTMPALRLDALAAMVRTCHGKADAGRAAELLTTMRGLVEGHRWRSEDRMPQVARLIELASLLGQADRARADAEAALKAYQDERDGIVDIYRAETLRPLALAWIRLGDRERGEDLFALAVEEGMENPNSRPRCDDLVDACVDLAQAGVDPSPKTWARLREIQKGLGEPW
jgi:hypothetical protein